VRLALLLGLVSWLLAGCNSMFYYPDRIGYWFPKQFALEVEEVTFEAADGTRLYAWFLPAEGRPKGTVVFFHGNASNVSNHLPVVRWLPTAGYSVLLFDYRGYGFSAGEPHREGLIQDGIAALDYVRRRPDVDPERIVVFGQSLGTAVAVSALARGDRSGVRALVLEGAFGSYREMARRTLDNHWLTWAFQYPVAYLLFSDDLRPLDDLPALRALPLLAIHSHADRTVPYDVGRAVYEAFPGPDKTFWELEQEPHIGAFVPDSSPWRAPLLEWLERRLPPAPDGPPAPPATGAAAACLPAPPLFPG
jgi:hypothetical protein